MMEASLLGLICHSEGAINELMGTQGEISDSKHVVDDFSRPRFFLFAWCSEGDVSTRCRQSGKGAAEEMESCFSLSPSSVNTIN